VVQEVDAPRFPALDPLFESGRGRRAFASCSVYRNDAQATLVLIFLFSFVIFVKKAEDLASWDDVFNVMPSHN
jgi:hypothetical protein